MSRTNHHRWSGGLSGTLLLATVGLLYGTPAPFVLAVVPLGYVVYGALSSYPEPSVTVERALEPTAPTPGTTVTVTLTVTNTGDRILPDVRVVDGVPRQFAVVDGTPRGCLSIPADESRTLTYAVMAKRGEYDFEATTVRARSLSGSRIRTTAIEAEGEGTLSCATDVERTPRHRATRSRTGTLPTDTGGSGLEFHSTREYRAGDPTNRIDWRRFARADELSTINFREERAVRLVLVVDARPPTRVEPQPGYPTGAELSAYAAERAYRTLTEAGHRVGVTVLGLDDVDLEDERFDDELPWVDPAAEGGSAAAVHELFDAVQRATDETGATATVEGDAPENVEPAEMHDPAEDGQRLVARLSPEAQVVVVTPLLDTEPVGLVETIQTHDVPVTVLSPDVVPGDSLGSRVTALRRDNTVTALRYRDVSVVDWPVDEPLDAAMDGALPRVLTG